MGKTEADRPAQEVEIAEEMIEAGAAELACFDPREDDPRVGARMIFEAMMSARAGASEYRTGPNYDASNKTAD